MNKHSNFPEFEEIVKNCDYHRATKIFNDLCKSNYVDGRKGKGITREPVGVYLFYDIYDGEDIIGVSEDSRLIEYQDILTNQLYGLLNRYKHWLEEFIEGSSLEKSKIIVKDHLRRANKLLNPNCSKAVIGDVIGALVEFLGVKAKVLGLIIGIEINSDNVNVAKETNKAGRKRAISSENMASKYHEVLNIARKSTKYQSSYHCIHRVGELKGQPNISQIALFLLENDEEIRNSYSSQRGLIKAINRSISEMN